MLIKINYSRSEGDSINQCVDAINDMNLAVGESVIDLDSMNVPNNKFRIVSINKDTKEATLEINEEFFIDSLNYLKSVYQLTTPFIVALKACINAIKPLATDYVGKWFPSKSGSKNK